MRQGSSLLHSDSPRTRVDRELPGGAATLLRGTALLSSLGASAIHFGAVHAWVGDSAPYAAGFAGLGLAQLRWAALVLLRPTRFEYRAGVIGNACVIAVWALSRSVGLPIGPAARTSLPVGFSDLVTTALETLVVTASLLLLRPGHRRWMLGRGRVRAGLILVGVVVVAVATVGVFSVLGKIAALPSAG